jgi:hypothetical protein
MEGQMKEGIGTKCHTQRRQEAPSQIVWINNTRKKGGTNPHRRKKEKGGGRNNDAHAREQKRGPPKQTRATEETKEKTAAQTVRVEKGEEEQINHAE